MKACIESLRQKLAEELPAELMAHSERVCNYGLRLAEKLGYEDKPRVELAGLAHDNCKHYGEEELLSLAERVEYEPDAYELAAPQILHAPFQVSLGLSRCFLSPGFQLGDLGVQLFQVFRHPL